MKNTKVYILIGVILVSFLGFHLYLVHNSPPSTKDILLEKIIKLEFQIESLNKKQDSIKYLITHTEDSIKQNEKIHEEIANIIISRPDSVNQLFIDKYIKDWRYNNFGSDSQ